MLKRSFDILIALSLLLVLMPVLLLVCILVAWRLGRPVFFVQERPGLNGKVFKLIKFRTMTDAKDKNGQLLSNADRLTTFGRYLRASSLDELPELWNVIKGEMSLVGPRPLLVEYLPLYSKEQMRRHGVRPGITGWAQVNGRNWLDWNERFKMDVWYVDNHTLWMDCKILFLTIFKVFKREGISQKGEATMKPFEGNPPS